MNIIAFRTLEFAYSAEHIKGLQRSLYEKKNVQRTGKKFLYNYGARSGGREATLFTSSRVIN
ncbi:MAG: hypothetical protein QXY52_00005 [Conexivisphaerales archaeon]